MKSTPLFLLWVSLLLVLSFGMQNCKKSEPDPVKPGPTTPGSTTTTPGTSTTAATSTIPVVSANAPVASGITSASASVSATIDGNGGGTISQHGFVFSKTAPTPTLTDSKTELGVTTGPFPLTITSKLTGLEANTTYYVRAYATNEKGTAYGAVTQVKTSEVPVASNSEDAETIYVGAYYNLYAFDAATGRQKAAYGITGGSVSADPAVTNDVVYTGYNTLMAYQRSTGRRLWEELGLTGEVEEPMTVAGDVLYVSTTKGKLIAYDPAKPTKKWETNITDARSPVVIGSTVYVSGSSGIVALNAADGTRKWSYGPAMYTGVAVAGGIAYATGQRNTLHAVDIATGTKKWSYEMGTTFDVLTSCATVANNTVYVGSGDKKLYAVDATTGAKKWDFLTGGTLASSPFAANGMVFFLSSDANLYAVDAATGTKKWNVSVGNTFGYSSPVVVNGIVYFTGGNKTLYAFDAVTGTEKWKVITAETLTSSPTVVAKNGKIFNSGRSGAQQ
ncbi:PQQ-binding-like beta-propeller repeat protein [Spirosoma sp.]|uniref:outer membrane protein assembly factor BamB family protein n=1 Tax=Spirosoma sp. TaxID=1899569 RepID=UPI003B3A1F3B